MELIIGNKNYSSWSLRAWLVVKASGLAFTERVIFLDRPETEAEIRRFSPSARVPVLIDGPAVIWDSLAIGEYLNERVPEKHLWPAEKSDRAHARCVTSEMHAGFADMRATMTMNLSRAPGAIEASDAVKKDVARVKELLTNTLARPGRNGPYLYGAFTIADAFFAPVLTRLRTYAVPVEGPLATYQATVLDSAFMKEWTGDGLAEQAKIEKYERQA